MARIQSSIGLITGVPIADTVDQLLAISARPRDALLQRTAALTAQQVAVTELTALVIGVQLAGDRLGLDAGFQQRVASSSDESLISVSVTGQPAAGSFQLTPVRLASTHQLLSSGVQSLDHALGESTFSFHVGDGAIQTVSLDADDTLVHLIDKINGLDAGVSAFALNDGSQPTPHRLSLVSRTSGTAGSVTIDASPAGMTFQEVAAAIDAEIRIGSAGAGVTATSSTNTFADLIDGVSIRLVGTSSDPVTVAIETSDSKLIADVRLFTDQFNRLREKLDELTLFDEVSGTTGTLFGSGDVLRIESELGRLLSSRFFGAGSIQSLGEVGLRLDQTGRLQFDSQKLRDRFAADPQGVRDFFTRVETGVVDKVHAALESLAGVGGSLLLNRFDALQRKIDSNNQRIEALNGRLARERERLLAQFFAMETAVARLQSSLTALESLQSLSSIGV